MTVFNPSLYLITDRALSRGCNVLDIVKAAVKGGVTMVQLREKELETTEFIHEAKTLKEFLALFHIPLIINDTIEVALKSGADGIHLGQDDMEPVEARRLLGDKAIIGLSVGHVQEMKRFNPAIVDYVGIGPAYATNTKTDAGRALGNDGVSAICSAIKNLSSSTRCVAIGGINQTNAAGIMQSGVDGIAIVSAICAADAPEQAARTLRQIVDETE